MYPGIDSIQPCIETLYRVFANYRFTAMGGDTGTCDPMPLLEAPLRDLSAKAFDQFVWKAMTTWGYADNFKHFLPRLLELLIIEVEPGGFSELPFSVG